MSAIMFNKGFWGNMACGKAQMEADNGPVDFLIKGTAGLGCLLTLMASANYVVREYRHITGQIVLSNDERRSLFKSTVSAIIKGVSCACLAGVMYSFWPQDLGSCGIVRYTNSDSDF